MIGGVCPAEDQCKLYRSLASSPAYLLLAVAVVDATPYVFGRPDICMSGLCIQTGCDRVIGSSARGDRCGVRRGRGDAANIFSLYTKDNFDFIISHPI